MSHLGPHTFPLARANDRGRGWVRRFGRLERHQLIEEDRAARHGVFGILAGVMIAGLALILAAIMYVAAH